MSRKQTRRSISVSGKTYEALMKKALEENTTCSGLVEFFAAKYLGTKAEPPRARRQLKPKLTSVSQQPEEAPPPEPEEVPEPVVATAKELKKAAEPPPLRIVKKEEAPVKKAPPPGDLSHKIFTF